MTSTNAATSWRSALRRGQEARADRHRPGCIRGYPAILFRLPETRVPKLQDCPPCTAGAGAEDAYQEIPECNLKRDGRQLTIGGVIVWRVKACLLMITAALSLSAVSAACAGGPSSPPAASTTSVLSSISTSASAPASAGPMKITDPYSPTIDPSAFSSTVNNLYFPLTPGTR